ncbi:MAG: magnesium transporter MgtE N-terminal domain-containing protein [Streptosporangiaceae bacterium]
MTTTPSAAPEPATQRDILRLSDLLKRPLVDRSGESIGRLSDVIARLRGDDYPLVTGLVATVGGREVYVPIEQVAISDGEALRLTSARLDLRHFERRPGEVLLKRDVLGHRLIDVETARLVRAADVELDRRNGELVVAGVDTRRRPPRLLRALPLGKSGPSGADPARFRDWKAFEPLIGHTGSALLRGPFGRIRRLKPAQIADLLEDASKEEETEILGQVHEDPELEADVFEELDEDRASRLLGARTDEEIAEVLSRMRPDDAADAIAELPQSRRQPVIDLLPPGARTKVLTLMGFNPASAGGLMGVDFLALPSDTSVAEAIAAVGAATTLEPEALTSVHAVDGRGCLRGVARLVTLLQADRDTRLIDACDTDPVRVGADTDVVDVAVLMTDYNLITIPVVDERGRIAGLITVDDVLEVTLPDDWRRRETAQPPSAPHDRAPHENAPGEDAGPSYAPPGGAQSGNAQSGNAQ